MYLIVHLVSDFVSSLKEFRRKKKSFKINTEINSFKTTNKLINKITGIN